MGGASVGRVPVLATRPTAFFDPLWTWPLVDLWAQKDIAGGSLWLLLLV